VKDEQFKLKGINLNTKLSRVPGFNTLTEQFLTNESRADMREPETESQIQNPLFRIHSPGASGESEQVEDVTLNLESNHSLHGIDCRLHNCPDTGRLIARVKGSATNVFFAPSKYMFAALICSFLSKSVVADLSVRHPAISNFFADLLKQRGHIASDFLMGSVIPVSLSVFTVTTIDCVRLRYLKIAPEHTEFSKHFNFVKACTYFGIFMVPQIPVLLSDAEQDIYGSTYVKDIFQYYPQITSMLLTFLAVKLVDCFVAKPPSLEGRSTLIYFDNAA
jgi:hypothetical protein